MGVTGFWTAKGDGPFVDSAAEGHDIYDGLAVPMVAPFTGNRMIIGGWLHRLGKLHRRSRVDPISRRPSGHEMA